MLVVQRAHNERLLLHFDGPVAFGLRLSRVFRQSLEGVFSEVRIGRDQNWYELLEDHSVRDARPVAAKRMIHGSFGQYRSELFPDGLDDICLERGHGLAPLQGYREASTTPRMIERSVPVLQAVSPYWRKLLGEPLRICVLRRS